MKRYLLLVNVYNENSGEKYSTGKYFHILAATEAEARERARELIDNERRLGAGLTKAILYLLVAELVQ